MESPLKRKTRRHTYILGFFCVRYTYLITDIIFQYEMNEPYFSQQPVLTKQINDTHNWETRNYQLPKKRCEIP